MNIKCIEEVNYEKKIEIFFIIYCISRRDNNLIEYIYIF